MRAEEIKDRETLRAWLEGRPREDAIAIAHRAALRVFPVFASQVDQAWARRVDVTALPVLRCCLISAVAALVPTADIRVAFAFALALAFTADAAAVGYLTSFLDVPRIGAVLGLGAALMLIAIVGVLASLAFAASVLERLT